MEECGQGNAAFYFWRKVIMKQTCRLQLFDLDGTLLRSDKSISDKTLSTLRQCREKGIMIGVSTSRSEQNSMTFLDELKPDILIASGGALIRLSFLRRKRKI